MFGLQALERIEHVHSKGIIHKDIKGNNFVISKRDPSVIYLIDFGLAESYLTEEGNHIPVEFDVDWEGTSKYLSLNCHLEVKPSRRDDLESLCYLLIFFLKGKLPWDG